MKAAAKILTPERFDHLIGVPTRPAAPAKVLWGADAIGRRLGVSADFVRDRLAHEEGSPIKKKAGRWCAVEDDLLAFFRQ